MEQTILTFFNSEEIRKTLNGVEYTVSKAQNRKQARQEMKDTFNIAPTWQGKIGSVLGLGNMRSDELKEQLAGFRELQEQTQNYDQDKSKWPDYIKSLTQGSKEAKEFAKANQALMVSSENSAMAEERFTTTLRTTTAATKAATVATKALNMVKNVALTLGISFAIGLAVKKIGDLAHANERAIETAQNLTDEYEEVRQQTEGNISTLEGLRDEFGRLSQGVDATGRNLHLTVEEYSRYKEIVAQIAHISPSLVKGYNNENVAIFSGNDAIGEAIELQRQLNAEKQQQYFASGNDILKGARTEVKSVKEELKKLVEGNGSGGHDLSELLSNAVGDDAGNLKRAEKVLAQAGIDSQRLYDQDVGMLSALAENREEIISNLQAQNLLDNAGAQALRDKIILLDVQLQKMRLINQEVSTFLMQWAANDENNEAWYGNIKSGYLDDFQKGVEVIASNPSLTSSAMKAELPELEKKFDEYQNTEPFLQLEALQKQLMDGTITAEAFKKAVAGPAEEIRKMADGLEDSALAAILYSIADGCYDYADGAEKAAQQAAKLQEATQELSSLQSAYKTLAGIAEEYNANGFLSLDSLEKLIALGPEYAQYLQMENGQLALNQGALTALTKARLNDLKASIVQQAVDLISSFKDEGKAAEYLAGKINGVTKARVADGLAQIEEAKNQLGENPSETQLQAVEKAKQQFLSIIEIIEASEAATGQNTGAIFGMAEATNQLTDSLQKEKEALQGVKAELEAQKSQYDAVIRAVQKTLDKEIEALEKQKEALSDREIEGSYGERIGKIQQEIDSINKLKSAQEAQIAVEKAKAELERAQRQKNQRVYVEGQGFVWMADESAVRNAKEALEKAQLDKQLSDLNEAKEKLEAALQQEEAAIDANIKKLQEYKDQWGQVADAYQDEQDRLLAAQVLGQNWEAEILNGRLETLTSFKDDYIAIMGEIAQNAEELEALEKRITDAQAKLNQANASLPSLPEPSKKPRYKVIDIYTNTAYHPSESDFFSSYEAAVNYINSNLKDKWDRLDIRAFSQGTSASPAGAALVDEAGGEIIVRPPRQGRLTMLEAGAGVIPAQATQNLVGMAQNPRKLIREQMQSMRMNGLLSPAFAGANQTFTFRIGDVVMNGVNDTLSFAKALVREFPSAMKQAMGK